MNEIGPILRTIREVEESLERRSERAAALVMMTWGAVATSIFLFYAAVQLDVAFADAIPRLLVQWAWVPPMLLGYLLTALVQVRLGRMRANEEARSMRQLLLVLVVPLVLLASSLTTGFGWQLVPAMWVGFLGYTCLAWGPRTSAAGRRIGIASLAMAVLLALPPLWPWASLVGAAWYAVFLFGRGVQLYHAA